MKIKTLNFHINKPFKKILKGLFMEAPPGLEPGIKVLQTCALPLGYSALIWSGRRDSNPQLSPWQGDTLPLSHFRSGGQTRNRTRDTRIFSPLLYRLSYLAIGDSEGARTLDLRRDRPAL